MDTAENSARPQSLPSKLRWRPYSTTAKKQKKDDTGSQDSNSSSSLQSQNQALGLQAKALAHRVREKSFRSAKAHNPPVGVQLQWEEAETIESMSRGGHPHNQHPPLYNHQRQQHQQQQQQQVRQRNLSDSNSDTDSDSYSSSRQLGVSSLPSPTPSKSPTTPVRNQPGGDLDLSHYKARLPGLTGDDFLDHGLPLPSIEANTVYQVAVNELLENHRRNMLAEKAPALAITSATSPSSTLANSTSQQQRRLSSSELLGISTIEELLVSCGYSEPVGNFTGDTAMRIPVSPATTHQSLHSSPASGIIDLQDTSRMSKTPMDISSASFDLLMAQTPVLLSEGDSKQILLQRQQQQQQAFTMDYLQNGLGWASASTPSPFAHISTTHDDPLINGNDSSFLSNWPSLFPKVAISTQSIAREGNNKSSAPRVDIAIQTDPLSPPLSGTSAESSPMTTHVDLTQEELDPDWLTFLEENPTLFPALTESSTEESPKLSSPSAFTTDNVAPPSSTTTTPTTAGRKAEPVAPPVREKGAWNWAEDFLKQGAMAPTGHRSFPTAGSFGSFSSGGGGIGGGGGSGGMIRTLRGAGGIGGGSGPRIQQRSAYHTQAFGRSGSAATPGSRGSNSSVGNSRAINAASVDERGKKEESQATTTTRIPSESTMHMQKKENKVAATTALEKESPGKKNSAEEESMRGKAKAGTDTTTTASKKSTTTTTTMTTEGFGGLLAMFRGLWKGNGGDKNGS